VTTRYRTKHTRVEAVAARQHGVITRRQAIAAGFSDSAIGRCVESGAWVRLHPGTYRVFPSADAYAAQLVAATLRAPGRAWASHRAAAVIWGLVEPPQPVEISTTANVRSARLVVHHLEDLPVGDRRRKSGVPVTSVERTLVDLGGLVSVARLEAAAVEALRGGLTSVARLTERVDALEERGRSGPRHLRRLLHAWGSDAAPPESVLESRLRRLLHRHSIPPGVPQLQVSDGTFRARLDLAYPEARVAVELDGYRWHGDKVAWRTDLARRNRLTGLGWRVLHFTWKDVTSDPGRVAAEIRSALHLSSISPEKWEPST
jgi:very-short-patch-repair endonuclease